MPGIETFLFLTAIDREAANYKGYIESNADNTNMSTAQRWKDNEGRNAKYYFLDYLSISLSRRRAYSRCYFSLNISPAKNWNSRKATPCYHVSSIKNPLNNK